MTDDSVEVQRKKLRLQHALWFFIMGLSETMGTFFLVFMLCLNVVPSISSTAPSHLQVCIGAGIAIVAIVQVFGPISGSHINPSVTVAAAVFRKITLPAAALYIACQLIGGILGYGTLLLLVPKESLYASSQNMNVSHGLCTTVPNPQVTTLQALLSEYAATSILIFFCCSVWDKKGWIVPDSIPTKFGLAIAGLAMAFGPISGAGMNPARTFGPAVFTGVWDRQWIYWLGPLTGSLLTAVFYKFVFLRTYTPWKSDQAEVPLNQPNA